MKTILEKIDKNQNNTDIIREAGRILKEGGLVAFPTETVYGLGADALNEDAAKKIYAAKGRPSDNPLIIHITNMKALEKIVSEVPEKAVKVAEKYWPGPLTMIFNKSDIVPYGTTGGLDTVAVRMPVDEIAREVIDAGGGYIAAPSANTSGRPSPTTAQHVMNDMDGKIDAVLDGGASEVGLESTVITLAGAVPRVLRPGGITVEMLESVLGKVEVDDAVLHKLADNVKVASPGMKYKHYAPRARVILLNCNDEQYIDYVNKKAAKGVAALCCDEDIPLLKTPVFSLGKRNDYTRQAHTLFDELRRIDEDDSVKVVYSRLPKTNGVGMAVYNRLIRAAGFEVIDLEQN